MSKFEKDIILSGGGFVYSPEELGGFLTEYCLREIADILEKKNRELFKDLEIED